MSAKIAASQDDVYVVWDDRTGKILGRIAYDIISWSLEAHLQPR
jgi:hypothetical protein